MRRLLSALACATLALTLARSLSAQEPGRIAMERYTLPNGLTVILAENHSTQVVAVDVWYNVGPRNERSGRTGFAHLFEHMMCKADDCRGPYRISFGEVRSGTIIRRLPCCRSDHL
ncbi:MAG: insulinase family protein [Gemmatimonadaceae bacterium]|nr:insulinase family protein [Gemmatimonadaceae bacterium]